MSENQDSIAVKRTVSLKDGFASVEYRHFLSEKEKVDLDSAFEYTSDKVEIWLKKFGKPTTGGIKRFNDTPKPPSDVEKKINSLDWRKGKWGEWCFATDFEKAGLEDLLMQLSEGTVEVNNYVYRINKGKKDGTLFINRREKK